MWVGVYVCGCVGGCLKGVGMCERVSVWVWVDMYACGCVGA